MPPAPSPQTRGYRPPKPGTHQTCVEGITGVMGVASFFPNRLVNVVTGPVRGGVCVCIYGRDSGGGGDGSVWLGA